MKLITVLSFLLMSMTVLAQTPLPPAGPDITIKRVYWFKEAPNPTYEPWPMFNQYFPQLEGSSLPRPAYERPVANRPAREYYTYSAEIRIGAKEIKAVAWDYIFKDTSTGKEMGRHSLLSVGQRGHDKSSTLSAVTRMLPIETLRGHPKPKQLAEIKCVLYQDDSVWCRPDVPSEVADALKRIVSFKRR
jgi:hypothetical protein